MDSLRVKLSQALDVRWLHGLTVLLWSAALLLGAGWGNAVLRGMKMVFTPNYKNSMPGNNEEGVALPFVSDRGTTFAVTVIPVDDRLAVKAR